MTLRCTCSCILRLISGLLLGEHGHHEVRLLGGLRLCLVSIKLVVLELAIVILDEGAGLGFLLDSGESGRLEQGFEAVVAWREGVEEVRVRSG